MERHGARRAALDVANNSLLVQVNSAPAAGPPTHATMGPLHPTHPVALTSMRHDAAHAGQAVDAAARRRSAVNLAAHPGAPAATRCAEVRALTSRARCALLAALNRFFCATLEAAPRLAHALTPAGSVAQAQQRAGPALHYGDRRRPALAPPAACRAQALDAGRRGPLADRAAAAAALPSRRAAAASQRRRAPDGGLARRCRPVRGARRSWRRNEQKKGLEPPPWVKYIMLNAYPYAKMCNMHYMLAQKASPPSFSPSRASRCAGDRGRRAPGVRSHCTYASPRSTRRGPVTSVVRRT